MKKILSAMLSLSFLTLLVVPAAVGAAENDPCTTNANCATGEVCVESKCTSPAGSEYGLGTGFTDVGLGQTSDLKSTIANIINIVLGFLGIVAVIIILAGGFKWMTAGGNEEKVAEARQMIIQGIIGLVVIFAAWAIASFVIANLQSATA